MLHEELIEQGYTAKKIQKLANDDTVRYRYYDSSGNLEYKACTKCSSILSRESFRVRTESRDGLTTACRTCTLLYERSYHKANPQVVKKKNKTKTDKLRSRSAEQIEEDRRRIRPTGYKRCRDCANSLPLEAFSNSICNPDGLFNSCKVCDKERQASLRAEDPGYAPAIQRNLRIKNLQRSSEQIDMDRKKSRPESTKKCQKCKRILHINLFYSDRGNTDGLASSCAECVRGYVSWRKKGSIEEQWRSMGVLIECYVCGGPWDHTDHVVPKELKGADDITNLLPMCTYHNTSKWCQPLDEWLYQKHPHDMERVLRKVIFGYGVDPFPKYQ